MLFLISLAILLLLTSVFLYNRTSLANKFIPADLSQPVTAAAFETESSGLRLFFHGNTENEVAYASKGSSQDKADSLSMEIDDLEWLLEKKKLELEEIRRDRKLSEQTAAQVDMIGDSIDSIEAKICICRQQLEAIKPIAVDLDELEINYQQLKNELAQSQHNYQDMAEENISLREQLEMYTEDLTAVRIEKQKLERKIVILESLNQDLQSMVDAWKARSQF